MEDIDRGYFERKLDDEIKEGKSRIAELQRKFDEAYEVYAVNVKEEAEATAAVEDAEEKGLKDAGEKELKDAEEKELKDAEEKELKDADSRENDDSEENDDKNDNKDDNGKVEENKDKEDETNIDNKDNIKDDDSEKMDDKDDVKSDDSDDYEENDDDVKKDEGKENDDNERDDVKNDDNANDEKDDKGSDDEEEEKTAKAVRNEDESSDDESAEDEDEDDMKDKEEMLDDEKNMKEEDPSYLERAWKMLELARNIYSIPTNIRKLCDTLLALGEVSIENENYAQAREDLNSCLEKRKDKLPNGMREIAETWYQLGVALSYQDQHTEAFKYFNDAINILENMLQTLKVDTFDARAGKIDELELLLPEIANRSLQPAPFFVMDEIDAALDNTVELHNETKLPRQFDPGINGDWSCSGLNLNPAVGSEGLVSNCVEAAAEACTVMEISGGKSNEVKQRNQIVTK